MDLGAALTIFLSGGLLIKNQKEVIMLCPRVKIALGASGGVCACCRGGCPRPFGLWVVVVVVVVVVAWPCFVVSGLRAWLAVPGSRAGP